MTTPKRWPNNQRHYRDRAAEETNEAVRRLKGLLGRVERGKYTRHGLEMDIARTIIDLQEALRNLEAAGAPTEPHY